MKRKILIKDITERQKNNKHENLFKIQVDRKTEQKRLNRKTEQKDRSERQNRKTEQKDRTERQNRKIELTTQHKCSNVERQRDRGI
jgi:hypothetical protein